MKTETRLSIIAIGISVLAVGMVASQFYIQYLEYENSIRPMIAVSGLDFNSKIPNFIYQNFGSVPNTGGTVRIDVDRNGYDIERLRNNPDLNEQMQIVVPTQQIGHTIELSQSDLDMTKNSAPLFVGILIEYQHNDRTYEYGVILKYSKSLEDFSIIESWIK